MKNTRVLIIQDNDNFSLAKSAVSNTIHRMIDPRFWLQLTKTDHRYSYELNKALDKVESGEMDIDIEKFTAVIGSKDIWIENYPYAFGYIYNCSKKLPTVKVRKRLKRIVDEKMLRF